MLLEVGPRLSTSAAQVTTVASTVLSGLRSLSRSPLVAARSMIERFNMIEFSFRPRVGAHIASLALVANQT